MSSYDPMQPVSQDDRTMAMVMWILTLFSSIIAPLIFVLVTKEKRFQNFHAGQALVVNLVAIPLYFCFGIGALVTIICAIVGAIKANSGEWWDVPVVGSWARSWFGH